MKYLLVVVCLLGFACATEDEEVSLQDLSIPEDIMDFDDLSSSARQTPAALGTLDPQLIIGNIVAFLNGLNDTSNIGDTLNQILGPILGTGATTAALGGIAAPILGIKGVVSAIVAGVAGLGTSLIGIANSILAIVGLVFLIIFLIDGGDFGSLLGVARSSSVFPEFDFDLVDNPVVESISNMFFSAMEKYDL